MTSRSKVFISIAMSSMLAACSSQGTIGDLDQSSIEEINEAQIGKLSHQQVRDQYQELLGLVDDDYIKEQIERRISGVYLLEADDKQNKSTRPARGYYRDAIASYRDILEKYPNSPDNAEVLYQLSKAYDLEGETESALQMMERLVKYHPDYKNIPEVYFRMGDIYFNFGRYVKAEGAYRQAAASGDNKLLNNSRYMLGWSQYKQGVYHKALENFAAVLDRLVGSAGSVEALPKGSQTLAKDTFHSMSLALVNLGGAEGIELVEDLNDKPYVWRLYSELADFYFEKNLFEDSAKTYREYITRNPENKRTSRFHTDLINVYVKGGFPTLVLEEKERYANLYGPKSDYYDDYPDLRKQINADLKVYYVELASFFHSQGQQALAKLKTKPDNADDIKELTSEKLSSATDFYKRYLTLFPNDKEASSLRYRKADAHFENEQFGKAARDYEKVAYSKRTERKAANKAGYAALVAYQKHIDGLEANEARESKLDKWREDSLESMLKFAEVFHDDTRSTAVLSRASQAMFALNQYDRAIKVAQGLLKRVSGLNADLKKTAYGIIAQSYFQKENYQLAQNNYIAQRKLVAKNSEEYNQISDQIAASVYKKAEKLREENKNDLAIKELLSIKTLAPASNIRVIAQYDAASLLLAAEQWNKAIVELAELKKRYSKHKLANEFPRKLAFAYEKQENWEEAYKAYTYLFRNDPDPAVKQEALFIAAGLAEKTKKDNKAIELYKDYARTYEQPFDNRMEARFKLASLYEKQKEYNKQLFWLRRIIDGDKKAGDQRTERSQWLGAWANAKYGDYFAWEFKRRKIRQPIENSISRKNQLIQDASERYEMAASYGILEFVTMSNFRIAKLYEQFGNELLNAPLPASLSAEEKALYQEVFAQQAAPMEEVAASLYLNNIELGWQGHYNNFIQQSFDEMKRLVPVRFDKTEQVARYGDEIR